VVDVGTTMAREASGRAEPNLDWAMRFVWSKLGDMAASGRKTLCAGLVAFRTRETANAMGAEDGYAHVSVLRGLGPVSLDALRGLQHEVVVNPDEASSAGGDAVSAVVVAVDMIDSFTKKQKWIRRVFLVTDGEAAIDVDDVDAIAGKMNASGIQLNVL
jgi:ATP-dependent DNA helicase 2 subunit 2